MRALPTIAVAVAATGLIMSPGLISEANAATTAVATSSSSGGMTFTGSELGRVTRISLIGNRFLIDDAGPVTAGPGCLAVAGDPTNVTCDAPTAGGVFKSFTAFGADGSDTIFNLTGTTMIAQGGSGNDTLHGSVTAFDKLSGGTGNDKLVGNGGNDTLVGEGDQDTLEGGDGGDTLVGGAGNDVLHGAAGDRDNLNGGTGTDVLDGGAGVRDVVDYSFSASSVSVLIGSTINGPSGENDTITLDTEDVIGSEFGDFMVGSAQDNRLEGRGGNDFIAGKNGADTLNGGSGADSLTAGETFNSLPDGAVDRLVGDADTPDSCDLDAVDGDTASSSCEKIF